MRSARRTEVPAAQLAVNAPLRQQEAFRRLRFRPSGYLPIQKSARAETLCASPSAIPARLTRATNPGVLPSADPDPRLRRKTPGISRSQRNGRGMPRAACPLRKLLISVRKDGCPTRIRTSIDGVRVRSLTIRRSGNGAAHLEGGWRRVKQACVPTPRDAGAAVLRGVPPAVTMAAKYPPRITQAGKHKRIETWRRSIRRPRGRGRVPAARSGSDLRRTP